jgi:hypothetical protein
MPATLLHRIAARLLAALVSLLPAQRREWGQALKSELEYIESGWAALGWAIGSVGFVFNPGDLFAEGAFMRRLRLTLPVFASLIVVVLLFAPSFREAFVVSFTTPWSSFGKEAQIEKIAAKAHGEKDADMLAWAALRGHNMEKSVEYADEAVAIDPSLTWIFYPIGRWGQFTNPARASAHIARLIAWDSQNAVPLLAKANMEDTLATTRLLPPPTPEASAWMTRALAAPRYDGYFVAHFELERRIARRTHSTQTPAAAAIASHPLPRLHSLQVFVRAHMASCSAGAPQACWEAARFGEMMQVVSRSSQAEQIVGNRMQAAAFRRLLESNAIADSNLRQTIELQAQKLDETYATLANPQWWMERRLLDSSAQMVQIGALAFVFAACVLAICLAIRIFRAASPFRGALVNAALALLGMSSIVVYVAYRPFAKLSEFLDSSAPVTDISPFFRFQNFWILPMDIGAFVVSAEFQFFWWSGLAALCVSTLALIAYRNLRPRPIAPPAQALPTRQA